MRRRRGVALLVALAFGVAAFGCRAGGACHGHFLNPVTDICWRCLFPISIGSARLTSSAEPDTDNPSSPLQWCPMPTGFRVGLAVGYWEPFATTDVTRSPFCLVNLGGIQLNITGSLQQGGAEHLSASGTQGDFYAVHWYRYPLIAWLNLITSIGCFEGGQADAAYFSELDPTWDDDTLNFILSPEAALFATGPAQLSCAGDAIAAAKGLARDALFWCLGSQGATYPLTGHVPAAFSPLQNATLLTERLDFKLHRLGIIADSSGANNAVCHTHYSAVLPKTRYRYELINPTPDASRCHPFGHTVTTWQSGKLDPRDTGNYGFLLWRKRNCVIG